MTRFRYFLEYIEKHRTRSERFWRVVICLKDLTWNLVQWRFTKMVWVKLNVRFIYPFFRNKDYTKFIILGHQRTGSNLLVSYLSSHSGCKVYSEILNFSLRSGTSFFYKQMLLSIPRTFNRIIFRGYEKDTQAVGFKLFYDQALFYPGRVWPTPPHEPVWSFLLSIPDLRIIHLQRRNVLRSYISFLLMLEDHCWVARENEVLPCSKVTVNCLSVVDYLNLLEAKRNIFRVILKDRNVLDVYYEDLTERPQEELRKIQDFLGLAPRHLSSTLKKLHPQKMSELVENYDELVATLRGTKWEACLADREVISGLKKLTI